MNELELELHYALLKVQEQSTTVPLLDKHYPVGDVYFRPMPANILPILEGSPNYQEIAAGDPPSQIEVTTTETVLGMVVYRAVADDAIYILGPVKPTLQ